VRAVGHPEEIAPHHRVDDRVHADPALRARRQRGGGRHGGAGAGLDHRDLGLEEVAYQLGRHRASHASELLVDEPLDRIAARQPDQALGGDVAPAHHRGQIARRVLGASEHQREARERQLDQSGRFLQRSAQRDVDLARLHHLHEARALRVDQLDVELRMQSSKRADRLRQELGGGKRRRADREAVTRGGGLAGEVQRRGFEVAQAAIGDRQELRAGLGQRHLARGALEQSKAELRLELAHQHAHSRLRDEELFRRAREALVPRREHEGLQLARGDIHANADDVLVLEPIPFWHRTESTVA